MGNPNKVIIYRRPAFRWEGIKEASRKLGCTEQALRLYLGGRRCSLGPAKRARVVVKTMDA